MDAQRTFTPRRWLFDPETEMARDVPLTRDDARRSKESLANARQNWLMYPENKTGRVPGVLPIFEGMRARFTTTESAEAGACKHSWGTVTGWVLHPDDSKLMSERRSEPELVFTCPTRSW